MDTKPAPDQLVILSISAAPPGWYCVYEKGQPDEYRDPVAVWALVERGGNPEDRSILPIPAVLEDGALGIETATLAEVVYDPHWVEPLAR